MIRALSRPAFVALATVAVLSSCADDRLESLFPVLVVDDGTIDRSGEADFLVDFGEVPIGAQSTRLLKLRNDGRAELVLSPLPLAPPFSTDLGAERILRPQDRLDVLLRFAPTEARGVQALAVVDSDGGSIKVRLTGIGYEPDATQCVFDVSPDQLDFGSVRQGDQRRLTFRITNKGTGDCTIQSLALTPDSDDAFSVEQGEAGQLLSAGDSTVVEVTFQPRSGRSYNGAVEFVMSSPATSRIVPLTGTCPGPVPAATEKIYLNDSSRLYSWDPSSRLIKSIGTFHAPSGLKNSAGMTDIAIDDQGMMVGCDIDQKLYTIDPTNAVATYVSTMTVASAGLTFLPDGRLVASGNGVWVVDLYSGAIAETIVSDTAMFSTSGDIIGLPDGLLYWVVRGGTFGNDDRLVQVDPANGSTTVIGSLNASQLYGVGYSNDELFAFSSAGKAIVVDPTTARQIRKETVSGSWWGATTNPVTWGP